MAIKKERCFPRGGQKSTKETFGNKKISLFDTRIKKKREKTKEKKSKQKNRKEPPKELISAEPLTNQSITDDMTLFGCVIGITDQFLSVSLPCRLVGRVYLTNISSPYTKVLKALLEKKTVTETYYDLRNMFRIGQYVVVKVTKKITTESNPLQLHLTLEPSRINMNYTHSSVKNGMVLHGAVKSIEDHGYMVDFGIKHLRAFLKTKNAQKYIDVWNNGKALGIGQLLPCLIQKVDSSSTATVVQVTADPTVTSGAVAELDQSININTLIPGTLVKSLVVENIHDGLMLEFLNFKGIVYRDHVGDHPPKLAAVRHARVLYTVPLLNTVYLSLLLGSKDLLATPKEDDHNAPTIGQIIKNAQVLTASKKGLLISLGKYTNSKGFLSRNRLVDGKEFKPERIKGLYPIGKEMNVRIIGRDIMENIYICSAQQSILNEEYYTLSDLKVGMKVTASVLALKEKGLEVKIGKSVKLKGFVHITHLADFPLQFPEKRFTKGKKVTAQVLSVNEEKKIVFLTLKTSLINSDLPILSSYDQAESLHYADGAILRIFENGLIITFYNNVKGFVGLSQIGHSGSDPINLRESFYEGQTVRCRIVRSLPDEQRMFLSLNLNEDGEGNYDPPEIVTRIGHSFTLKVEEVNDNSLFVEILGTGEETDSPLIGRKGIVPDFHLTDHISLANSLLKTYKPGDILTSTILYSLQEVDNMQRNLVFSLRPSVFEFCSSFYVKQSADEDESDSNDDGKDEYNKDGISGSLDVDSVIPCSLLEVKKSGLLLDSPIPKYGRDILVPEEHIADNMPEKIEELGLIKHQVLYGKVIKMDFKKKKVILGTKLSGIWDGYDLMPAVSLATTYLADIHRINKKWKLDDGLKLGRFRDGQKVQGTVKSLSKSEAHVEVDKIVGKKVKVNPPAKACVIYHHYKNKEISVGDRVEGRVIFVDHAGGKIYLTLKPKVLDELEGMAGEEFIVGKQIRAEVLLCDKEISIAFVKGGLHHGEFVYLPTRCHHNDFYSSPTSEYSLKPGEILKVIISGKVEGKMIAMPKKYVNELNKRNRKEMENEVKKERKKLKKCEEKEACDSESNAKRRKLDVNDANEEAYAENVQMSKHIKKQEPKEVTVNASDSLETRDDSGSIAKKRRILDEAKHNAEEETSTWDKLPRLQANEGFVWNVDIASFPQALPKMKDDGESSSDDEDMKEEVDSKDKKGKKKKDNAALREEEEARVREAEERLMDPDTCPQTADDYDRLILSSPDSSIIWLKYVAFHLQNTEIEKARAVAQRALKTINFREEQEKLNIWVCLLNLENLYGTKESLEKVLQDALQMNDSFKVYCQMLQIYLDSKKIEELDSLMDVMLKKFKDSEDAWVQAGTICMKSNRPEKAGELLRRSFKSLPKRLHVNVICRWAQLEARSECGSVDRAQSLLEGVLAACPKRTDIWSSLTDTLVKAGRIDEARNVLERAVSQKLPIRKMKVLFKKYLSFEETHGTPENVTRVRQLAADYVNKGLEDQ